MTKNTNNSDCSFEVLALPSLLILSYFLWIRKYGDPFQVEQSTSGSFVSIIERAVGILFQNEKIYYWWERTSAKTFYFPFI